MRAERRPGSGREFVVARRDPPTLFDPIEEPFDQVARTVEVRAEAWTRTSIAEIGRSGPDLLRSQRWMISAGYGRRGRPAQTLSRACTASRWYPSTWLSNGTEMSHDSRLLFAYFSVASAAKEA